MKKVLFIAPASCPVHGAESIVNMKLLKALFACGHFDIDLISREEVNHNYPSPPLESYGLRCYHKIIKVGNKKTDIKVVLQNLMTLFKFGVWFPGCHWAYPGLLEAERLVKKKNYDYVITKNPPSFLIGYYLKKKYGMKWVASWNDPYPHEKYIAPYGKGADYKSWMVNRVTRRMSFADVHLFPNERLLHYMSNYVELSDKRTMVVPHMSSEEPVSEYSPTDTLRLIHTGNLNRPRNSNVFLLGLQKALGKRSNMRIKFSLLGLLSDEDKQYAEKLGLAPYIEFLKPVEYKKSLEIASQFDIAVIIEADCEEGIFLPTKVGDYMQLHLPIFAISPQEGVLNDLYCEHYVSYFANVKNANDVCEKLLLIYDDFKSGKLSRTGQVKKEYLPEYIVSKYLEI